MLDYIPSQKQSMEMRLDRIGKIRTFNLAGGKDTAAMTMGDTAAKAADDTAAQVADDLKAETPDDPNMEGGEGFTMEEDLTSTSKMEELADRGLEAEEQPDALWEGSSGEHLPTGEEILGGVEMPDLG